MAAAVGGKKSMRNGRGKPTRRISSSSSSNSDYVVIDKPGEQRHVVVEKEGEQTNGSTSPSDCSSVTSESAAASHLASGKVRKNTFYLVLNCVHLASYQLLWEGGFLS